MQDNVDVPELPVIIVTDRLHERLVEFVASASMTVPEKAFTGATVIVDSPATPMLAVTPVGLAVTLKLSTRKIIVELWTSILLVAETFAR